MVKIGVAVALGLPLALYFLQDKLIFHPQPLAELHRSAIAASAPNIESVFISAADGTRLHAWHFRARSGAPLVLYFGGNAEEVSWMLGEIARRASGAAWLLVDYRGYGSSGGAPSETALNEDALLWYDRLSKDAKTVFLLGRSLGSGVAVRLAAERRVDGLVLVAPFDSLAAVAKHHYPFLPVDLMLRHRFDSISLAPRISAPLLCIVAPRDEIIPAAHARRLYEAWGGPKRWVELDGAGHNSTDDHPAFWPSITAFISK
jgi:pimeloyl-ACP methyl ester carboxylesterase